MGTVHTILFVLVLCACFIVNHIIDNLMQQSKSNRKSKYSPLNPPNPEDPLPSSFSPLHRFPQAAVSSDSAICSQIGSNLLKQNGSGVDAAIGTLMCNGLVTMQSMSLGGGLLLIFYSRTKRKSFALIGREVAPLLTHKMNLHEMKNSTVFHQSGHTIGVPAEVMGYAEMHERFGILDWSKIVQPTLNICYKGFILTKHMRDSLLMNRETVLKDQHLSYMFYDKEVKDFYRYGTKIQPPKELCKTYEKLLVDGPRSFYRGLLSKKVLADLSDMGSFIRKKDFMKLKVKVLHAPTIEIDDLTFHLIPPPGSGLVISFVANILKFFKRSFQKRGVLGDLGMHRIVEALKFGFVQRWQLDHSLYNKNLNVLLNSTYAEEVAKLIEYFTLKDIKHYGFNSKISSYTEYGTGHVSIIAPNGDAVSVTSSVNFYFGSGRTGQRTGILFNNVMSDFALDGMHNYFKLPHLGKSNRP